jgi:riboflavin kinase/FMN adenylyltransferase
MQVHKDLAHLPVFNNAVITIGTFDGVHLGHQQIINQLKHTAQKVNGETVIITFHPHPRSIVGTYGGTVALLNTLEEKIFLLEKAGINHLVIVPFDKKFASQTAEAYCKDFIYSYFKPHTVIIGYDHRFGKNRTGDYHLLEEIGLELGFDVKEIDEKILNTVIVSSTRIRNALLENDIKTANEFLGYSYFFEGEVVKGNQLGRTIGYPTANIKISSVDKLMPADGVYAVLVNIEQHSRRYLGMMNIGFRPTVDGTKRLIEVNIFDFNKDIYGRNLRVHIHEFLRNEIKFSDLDALIKQLQIDGVEARVLLKDVQIS